jgi:hypothetical protein
MNTGMLGKFFFGTVILGLITFSVINTGLVFIFCLFMFLGFLSITLLMFYSKYLSLTGTE